MFETVDTRLTQSGVQWVYPLRCFRHTPFFEHLVALLGGGTGLYLDFGSLPGCLAIDVMLRK